MPLRGPSSWAEIVAFVFFAAVALAGAVGTISARNPIRGAVGLFFNIVALAGLYLTLSAHFLGVIQLLIYAGAVVVLFVFVIMLLGPAADTPRDNRRIGTRALAALCVASSAAMVVPQVGFVQMVRPSRPEAYGTLKQVGMYLFTDAVVPFELIGVTLVVAVVGAFAVARGRHRKHDEAGAGEGDTKAQGTGAGGSGNLSATSTSMESRS